MRLIALLFFCLGSIVAWAQADIVSELTRKKPGEGTVVLHQDARLKALLQADARLVFVYRYMPVTIPVRHAMKPT